MVGNETILASITLVEVNGCPHPLVPLCWIVVWRLRSPDCAGRFEGRASLYLQVVSKLYITISLYSFYIYLHWTWCPAITCHLIIKLMSIGNGIYSNIIGWCFWVLWNAINSSTHPFIRRVEKLRNAPRWTLPWFICSLQAARIKLLKWLYMILPQTLVDQVYSDMH